MNLVLKNLPTTNYGEAICLIWKTEINKINNFNQNPCYKTFYNDFESYIIDEFIYANGIFTGAYYDNQLVGVIGKKTNYIMFLYVKEEYQHQGIGTSLLNKVIESSKQEKLTEIWLDSSIESYSLYRKIGFVVDNFVDIDDNVLNYQMVYKIKG